MPKRLKVECWVSVSLVLLLSTINVLPWLYGTQSFKVSLEDCKHVSPRHRRSHISKLPMHSHVICVTANQLQPVTNRHSTEPMVVMKALAPVPLVPDVRRRLQIIGADYSKIAYLDCWDFSHCCSNANEEDWLHYTLYKLLELDLCQSMRSVYTIYVLNKMK